MLVHRAYKYRLNPNQEQERLLARQFGASRFVYNYFLRQRIDLYAAHKGEQKQGLNYYETTRALTLLKRLSSSLPTVSSPSYYVGSVGQVSEETVQRYIAMQKGRA